MEVSPIEYNLAHKYMAVAVMPVYIALAIMCTPFLKSVHMTLHRQLYIMFLFFIYIFLHVHYTGPILTSSLPLKKKKKKKKGGNY